MKVKELIQELMNCNQDADVVIDMIDRKYSCFEFLVDKANHEFVYLVDDNFKDIQD